MTDSVRMPDVIAAVRRLPAGSAVIVRHRDDNARARLASVLSRVARRRRIVVLVAGDWRLAARLRLDGVHLPERVARRGVASGLKLWARRRLMSVAAHGASGVRRAAAIGADVCILGAILPTASHPERSALGRVRSADILRHARVPTLALGGIASATLVQLNGLRIAGVAGVGFAARAQN